MITVPHRKQSKYRAYGPRPRTHALSKPFAGWQVVIPRPLLHWMALLLLALPLAACLDKPPDPPRKSEPGRHLVEVYTLSRQDVSTTYERTGSLRFRRLARIYNQEEGRITQLPWFEGDTVIAGDTLVRLEDDLIQAELAKSRAGTRQARLDLERIQGLANRKAISQDELTRSRTALDIAAAEERMLSTRLGYTHITAPFGGVITERHAEPGDVVSQHSHLLTLADPESMVVAVPVSELLLPLVARGDSVDIIIDALGPEVFKGAIHRIHPELDPLTRKGTIEITFQNLPAGARAGQFARARLTSAARARLMVPFGALRHDRDGEFIYVLKANTVQRLPVRSGLRIKDRIEILEGVGPGQRIVVRGFLGLGNGKQVEVVNGGDSG